MNKVVITMTDDGGDNVNVSIDFGEAGASEDSAAHRTALGMLASEVNRGKPIPGSCFVDGEPQ